MILLAVVPIFFICLNFYILNDYIVQLHNQFSFLIKTGFIGISVQAQSLLFINKLSNFDVLYNSDQILNVWETLMSRINEYELLFQFVHLSFVDTVFECVMQPILTSDLCKTIEDHNIASPNNFIVPCDNDDARQIMKNGYIALLSFLATTLRELDPHMHVHFTIDSLLGTNSDLFFRSLKMNNLLYGFF